MKEVKIYDVVKLARKATGQIHHIYVHWTAGHHDALFADYHLNITGDGKVFAAVEDFTQLLSHTWHRNSQAIGIALCCGVDAVLYGDGSFACGPEPPTQVQIETASILLAVLSKTLNIPLEPEYVMTHAEAADLDGYGPQQAGTPAFERWDLWKLPDYDGAWKSGGEVLRGKALYYKHKNLFL